MILVDTSVWIDHFRRADAKLGALLEAGQVLGHPFVTAELALGTLRQRSLVIEALQGLPQAAVATHAELLLLIEREGLAGMGIGHVDAHLIASTRLMGDARLWTRDKRLEAVAQRMKLAIA